MAKKIIILKWGAGMAKLADALASGASGRNPVGVQISLPALRMIQAGLSWKLNIKLIKYLYLID